MVPLWASLRCCLWISESKCSNTSVQNENVVFCDAKVNLHFLQAIWNPKTNHAVQMFHCWDVRQPLWPKEHFQQNVWNYNSKQIWLPIICFYLNFFLAESCMWIKNYSILWRIFLDVHLKLYPHCSSFYNE